MTKIFYPYIFLVLIYCFSVGIQSCKSLKHDTKTSKKKELANKDLLSYDEIKKEYEELIEKIDIKKGDVIADVGASLGIDDFSLSVLTDSVSYYIQDISSEIFRKKRFAQAQDYFNSLRKSPQTNKLKYVIGNKRKSCLPDSSFDKILLFNTLHEFNYVKEMLDDLYLKLKSNGNIIIKESISENNKKHIIGGCNTTAFTENEIIKIMKDSKFRLDSKVYPDSIIGRILIFYKE